MISTDEFRTGLLSLPATDAEDLPPRCFACVYLAHKEFSVGDGLYYYFCGYHWPDRINRSEAACLQDGPESESGGR